LPKYELDTGEEYTSRKEFFNSRSFIGFLGLTQSIITRDLSREQQVDYIRRYGKVIRDALESIAILNQEHHYVLFKNPGQILREVGINHPNYSELELEVLKLKPS